MGNVLTMKLNIYVIEENDMLWRIRTIRSHNQSVVLQGNAKAIEIIILRLRSYLYTRTTTYQETAPEELLIKDQATVYSSTQYVALWLFYLYCLMISQRGCQSYAKTCKKHLSRNNRNRNIIRQCEIVFRP